MKKWLTVCVGALLLLGLGGCAQKDGAFEPTREISVVAREDGSGTRGAFVDLFDIVLKGENGTRKDRTTKEAIVAKQTDVIITNIAGDLYAIGYISLGSLGDSVRAVAIDGVPISPASIKDGSYFAVRPFYIATKGEPEGATGDFIDFILSAEGQAVVAGSYIEAVEHAAPYIPAKISGKVVVAGSSSVTPIMEKLKEAYIIINPNVTVEIQLSDSSSGMQGVIDGTCDIAMASRDLKESERAVLVPVKIALDGIAVIVNRENPTQNLSKAQIYDIFTGEITCWNELD